MTDLLDVFPRLGHPRLLVLGDLMLDRYTWGAAERVSPEAPVLVLRVDHEEVRLGGAASVAGLLRALEAEVLLAGVVGDDPEGRVLCRLLREEGVEARMVLCDPGRQTTTKERLMGRAANRHPQQIVRVDREQRKSLSSFLEERLGALLSEQLPRVQAVLVSDYGKGTCMPRRRDKIVTLPELVALAETRRRQGKRVVFTNGCFDLLHVGHVTYLQEAARLGDVLVVALNSDAAVRRLKGPGRPVIKQGDRAALLAALACVDFIVVFEEDTPHHLLHQLRPEILVKGGTYAVAEVVGREVVEDYGGEVRVLGAVPGVSTTDIVTALRGSRV